MKEGRVGVREVQRRENRKRTREEKEAGKKVARLTSSPHSSPVLRSLLPLVTSILTLTRHIPLPSP